MLESETSSEEEATTTTEKPTTTKEKDSQEGEDTSEKIDEQTTEVGSEQAGLREYNFLWGGSEAPERRLF